MDSRVVLFIWGCSFLCLLSYSFVEWMRDRFRLNQGRELRRRFLLWLEIVHSMESSIEPPPSMEEIDWALEKREEKISLPFLGKKLKNPESLSLRKMEEIGLDLALLIERRRNSDTSP